MRALIALAQTCPSSAGCQLAAGSHGSGTVPFSILVTPEIFMHGFCMEVESECRAYTCYIKTVTYSISVPGGTGPFTVTNYVGSITNPTQTQTKVNGGSSIELILGDEDDAWRPHKGDDPTARSRMGGRAAASTAVDGS
jgi:hypothetical protein